MMMIFVERDQDGNIVSLRREANRPGMECKQAVDREIVEFLGGIDETDAKIKLLALTDTAAARILEDLLELLIDKELIMFTELPEEAQQKILARKRLRQRISREPFIVDDII